MSDVSRRQPPVQWVKTVECKPAETNQDETIEESFDDFIVSQELKPRIVLKYFNNLAYNKFCKILAPE